MAATIKDVAQLARVSVGTVSNVLNGKSGQFNEDTCQRVLQAVQALNYHPNRIARSLVQRASRTLGVSFTAQTKSLSANPYVSDILDGLMYVASKEGYNLTLYTRLESGHETQHLSTFLDRSIDALCLIAPHAQDPLMGLLAQTPLPFVVVGVESPYPGVSWVDVDNVRGAELAMECLYAAGHRRIAHLGGVRAQKSAQQRAETYTTFLHEHHLPIRPDWLAWCNFETEEAQVAARAILSSPDRPTAIFAADDLIALGVLQAATELGLRVPTDLSLVGFDDIQEAEFTYPPLTTIRQPVRQIGEQASRWLISHLRTPHQELLQQCILPLLIERSTVGPPSPF